MTIVVFYKYTQWLPQNSRFKTLLTFSICSGQLSPVASTGISSYLSKLIPVLLAANSSLKTGTDRLRTTFTKFQKAANAQSGVERFQLETKFLFRQELNLLAEPEGAS